MRWCGGSSTGWTQAWSALAHHDPDVYRDCFELVLRRESVAANDLWHADDDMVDFGQLDAVASAEPVR